MPSVTEAPVSLATLQGEVQSIVQHTRPVPVGSELNQAINFGYGKVLRALLSVRPQLFVSFVDPFTIVPGTIEYDVGLYVPQLYRPVSLLVDGSTTAKRSIFFKYRAWNSPEFQAAQVSVAGTWAQLLYDILTGAMPGSPGVTVGASTPTIMAFADTSMFALNGSVRVPAAGVGGADYTGLITTITGISLTVTPNMTTPPLSGTNVYPLRRRVMRIVPQVRETLSGRLDYQYRPRKLVDPNELLDLHVSDYTDCIEWYAASMLLQGVNDAQARAWFDQAQEMRSEAMQDIEPLSGQGSEELGTDLDWIAG